MKRTLFLFLLISIFACNKEDCIELELENPTTVKNQDYLCINGQEYQLLVDDARCPCETDCFWEGEFVLSLQDANDEIVFIYNQIDSSSNESPFFAETFEISNVSNEGPCGDPSKVDMVLFEILIQ